MNRDDGNLGFNIYLALLILMMMIWRYMDVGEASAAVTTNEEETITVKCNSSVYEIPLEGYKYYFVAYDTEGYAKVYISNAPLEGYLQGANLYLSGTGGDVITYGVASNNESYLETRNLYDTSKASFGVANFENHESNYDFYDVNTGAILYAANSAGNSLQMSDFESLDFGDYPEQISDIVNVCDRMYVVQYIGYDNLLRTQYCFLKPDTDASIISFGSVFSGCTYYLPYDYAVTVYEHTVQSVTTMSGTQAFYKTDDITACMLLGATFDIDLSSILPDYNYNKYSYPAAPESEEPDEPVVDYTPPTAQELLDALPAEAKFYTDCIILQQEHEDAWTNDIVFYCWDVPEKYEQSTYLILRWGDSLVVAVNPDGEMMTGTLKGYWDYATASWIIDAGTKISQTRNSTYSVPKIYYCSTNLYRQVVDQYELIPDGEACLYMYTENGFLDSDPFEEDEDDDSGFWGKLKKFFKDLFIPNTGYFQRKVTGMTNKFKFFRSIVDTANFFYDFMTTTDFSEPPVLVMDLSASTSRYDYGTSAVALDMSWYAQYKPSVDVLLSSVLWLVFSWNTFKALPNIIRGAGHQIFTSTDISRKDDTK